MKIPFPVGTVFKLHGELKIVTKNTTVQVFNNIIQPKISVPYTEWIPISGINSFGGSRNYTYTTKEACDCDLYSMEDSFEIEENEHGRCKDCDGTKKVNVVHIGMDQAEFIASDVKTYILNSLLKNFNL